MAPITFRAGRLSGLIDRAAKHRGHHNRSDYIVALLQRDIERVAAEAGWKRPVPPHVDGRKLRYARRAAA